jgi:multisubunit Na+/H+ antiporter MnhB subunit
MNPAVIAFCLFVGMLLCIDLGYRLGRRAQRDPLWHEGIGALEAAVYGLLGLLLGFAFSGATSRFEAHRQLSVKEANAIGTAYLRLDQLPAEQQPELRRLFRDYLDARVEVQASVSPEGKPERGVAQSAQLQQQIWSRAVAASRTDPTQNSARMLLPAINDMMDVTTERSVAFQAHLPVLVFYLLVFIALMSALLAGYGMAKRKKRSPLHIFLYAACVAATIYAVTDLEHPRSGLIRLDAADQALLQVRDLMR